MIFFARATRGLRRPSLDARSGRSSGPILEEITSECGGIIYSLVRRAQLVTNPGHPLKSATSKLGRVVEAQPDRPSCSLRPHDQNVLPQCAQ
jgi:hypothetical protein